ncbi:MAG: hypothetical protein KKG09_09345 [Verrucomicrobia bacterium]|nr:hypothetical protein [Verrucomicrobiota bacterium]MBU4247389.1 hypothetical protein [Verrucomicrobiota bacterium]MBU4292117.1 hypothetical protein [Verrucomicrobiota bacterium]MBU4498194.1 hypothetical protein [Verrucomicrobiota bacterium]MCG2681394.1 hypothetical protein [Kiritimatiellia bacterium]
MEQIGMVVMAIVGLVALLIVAGWIVPLILSIIGRRRHWPSARVWRVLAAIWGGVAALLACGVSALIFFAYQIRSSYEGDTDAPLFNAITYEGKTGCLRLAYTDEVECVFRDAAGKSYRCASSNGNLVVPAGALTLRECEVMASDSEGKPWNASFRSGDKVAFDVGPDAVENIEFGPPFLLAVKMEYTPVSSTIRLDPACADRAGNIYRIKSDSPGTVPSFQFLDASRQVIWSGKFEAG